MPKPQPKKHFQIQRLFGLAKDKAALAGLEAKECLEDLAYEATRGRTASLSALSFDEANDMIKALGGEPFRSYGHSRRNENYRKQQAGIKTIETPAHLDLIGELAKLNGMTEDGPAKLAARMNIPWPTQTTEQGNKIIEALKAMLERKRRDGLVGSRESGVRQPERGHPARQSKEPKFRRVA